MIISQLKRGPKVIDGKTIGVVIPAYNERGIIRKVFETMPAFVDYMITINDCSKDDTLQIIKEYMTEDDRIVLIDHPENKGLGQSLIDGYLKAIEMKIDVTAVMAGDGQMAPEDLISVVQPIVDGTADYTKGYRLTADNVKQVMPRYRYVGNMMLTLLTKFATGYWHVIDPQCGYTAISLKAISSIPIETMTKRYGYNADILNMLNLKNFKVKDVAVQPIYGEEKSKIKLYKYIPTTSILLLKLFFKRLRLKHMLTDFNPFALFYFAAMLCGLVSIVFGIRILVVFFTQWLMPSTSLIIWVFFTIMCVQFLFFGMWMDMEANKELRA